MLTVSVFGGMLPPRGNPKKACLVFTLVLLVTPVGLAVTYTTIDYPGATYTLALGINTAGDIVGAYTDPTFRYHGFLLSQGIFTTIDAPGSAGTYATGINDNGEIVGFYGDPTVSATHAFILQGQTFTIIDFPGSPVTAAEAINNAGVVAGYYDAPKSRILGFEYSNGVWTTFDPLARSNETILTGINNNGDLFGFSKNRAFLYSGGVLRFVKSPPAGSVLGTGQINDQLQATGEVQSTTNGEPRAFSFQPPQTFRFFSNPSFAQSYGQGINNFGEIVGYFADNQGAVHGFLAVP
jgi:hypothetical protein